VRLRERAGEHGAWMYFTVRCRGCADRGMNLSRLSAFAGMYQVRRRARICARTQRGGEKYVPG
jgi:hypothetical protein